MRKSLYTLLGIFLGLAMNLANAASYSVCVDNMTQAIKAWQAQGFWTGKEITNSQPGLLCTEELNVGPIGNIRGEFKYNNGITRVGYVMGRSLAKDETVKITFKNLNVTVGQWVDRNSNPLGGKCVKDASYIVEVSSSTTHQPTRTNSKFKDSDEYSHTRGGPILRRKCI
jgi:hypothetical protein